MVVLETQNPHNSIFIAAKVASIVGKNQVLEHEELLDLLHDALLHGQLLVEEFVHVVAVLAPGRVLPEEAEAPLALARQRPVGEARELLQQRPLREVFADAALAAVARRGRRAGVEGGAELPQRLQDALAGDLLAAGEHAVQHVLQQRQPLRVRGERRRRVRVVQQQQTHALDGADRGGDAQRRVLKQ